ncbi:hypothetical protein AB7W15_16575, partial [Morganella morganii]
CRLLGANTPWKRVRLTLGFGTRAASLGYLLSSLGVRRPAMAPLLTASRTPLNGSFVSFSIET